LRILLIKGFVVLEGSNQGNICRTSGGEVRFVQNGIVEQRRADRIWEIEASREVNIEDL
jgi:hypothetical protein